MMGLMALPENLWVLCGRRQAAMKPKTADLSGKRANREEEPVLLPP